MHPATDWTNPSLLSQCTTSPASEHSGQSIHFKIDTQIYTEAHRNTSSWPARETFSFLNMEVSKSREVGDLTEDGAETMRAARTEPEVERMAGRTRARSDLKEGVEEEMDPRLWGTAAVEGFRVLEEVAEEEAEIEKEVGAGAAMSDRSWWNSGMRRLCVSGNEIFAVLLILHVFYSVWESGVWKLKHCTPVCIMTSKPLSLRAMTNLIEKFRRVKFT